MKGKKAEFEKKQLINWNAVHRRLEEARSALDREWAPTAEQIKKVLKERAIALAREPQDRTDNGEGIEVVEFLLAHERYGIESSFVHEVYPLKDLTPLPGTPPFVLGIINVRGRILSVMDLRKFFDLPEKGLTDLNKVLVLRSNPMTFGILADSILGVRRLPTSELQPTLPTLTGIREEYLRGVGRDRLAVLDARKLLHDEKILVSE
jgi:purine-binding chemotaxis protein CheW